MRLVGLFVGGTDPDASQVAFLETATKAGLVAAIATLPMGAVAAIIGPHRLAALFGLGLSIAFFVYFAAWFTVFFTS